jgi:hypothetical protein
MVAAVGISFGSRLTDGSEATLGQARAIIWIVLFCSVALLLWCLWDEQDPPYGF